MPPFAYFALIAGAVVALWVVVTFNAFVRLRNRVREAFSGVDVQLKRRHNLVPNLVRVVEAYAAHERRTFEEVVRARGVAGRAEAIVERERSESNLGRSLDGLLALVEAYPALQADEGFRKLQEELVEIEEQIQYARRYYNGAVRDLNNRLQQFPANLLAPPLGVNTASFFELEAPEERRAPRVGETLGVLSEGRDGA